jgi:parvulin-like peptidyl-prolyl isomerase
VLRRAIWIGYVLAGLVAVIAVPLQGQAARSAVDFVILKADDVTPASVRLTVIVVDTKVDSESVRRKLQSGTAFESLAKQYSTHPSAVDGGEFGVFPVADLRPEFRAALAGIQ